MVAPRRAALALCALALAPAAAGCGSGDSSPADRAKTRDLDILTRAVQRENRIIAAAAAVGGQLEGRDAELGRRTLAASETHTAYLTKAIHKLGGTPHQPRRDYSAMVGDPRGRRGALTLLAGQAGKAAVADRQAADRVSDDDFRDLTLGVAASDRRRAEALRRALAGS